MSAYDDIAQGLDEIRRSAFVSGTTKKSYRQASPQEAPRVFAYLDGGAGPSEGMTAAIASWEALSPTGLWLLNQTTTSDPVIDRVGAGDQTAINGTTVSAESSLAFDVGGGSVGLMFRPLMRSRGGG